MKSILIGLASALLLIAALAFGAQKQDEVERQLKAAMNTELVDGNLKAAIEQYKKVAASGIRPLAAQALIHMAECYQKLGDAESRKTYERVLREYSDQKEAVATARTRLGSPGNAGSSEKVVARLVTDADVGNGCCDSITADGRFGAAPDWRKGDLLVRDMVNGQVKVLLAGSLDPLNWNGQYSAWPVISPDRRQVAFSRYDDKVVAGNGQVQGQLWVMPNDAGAKPRRLVSNPEYRNVPPYAWSPDGKSILTAIERIDGTFQLAWISVSDGAITVLKTLPSWEWPGYRIRVSPDGRYIAYSAQVRENSTDRYLYLLPADGSRENVLTRTAAINEEPVWTPDGTHVLFMSNRSGSFDLWSVAVREGKEAAPPQLIKRDVGKIGNIGLTTSGSYYYKQIRDGVEQVLVADIEPTSGKVRGKAAQVTASVGIRPTWSSDGKSLAFTRHRGSGGEEYELVVHSLESREEKVYSRIGLRPNPPGWFRDGASLLMVVQNAGRNPGLYRVDLKSGEFGQVLEFDPKVLAAGAFALSPDDQTLYVPGRDPKNSNIVNRIVAIDLATGEQNQICALPATGLVGLKLSPDGRTLAIRREDRKAEQTHVARVEVNGNDYRELYNSHSVRGLKGLEWSRDGQAILFIEADRQSARLMRMPIDAVRAEFTGLELGLSVSNIDLDSTGSRIAFSSAETTDEVWALDNVLSAVKAAR